MSDTVVLVNPRRRRIYGRRWAEMAHRATTRGSKGTALPQARAARDLARQAADGGAKLLVVGGGDGR